MFLELHLLDNGEKIILNTDNIQSIYQDNMTTCIYIGEVVYRVKENYERIKNCISEITHIEKEMNE